MKTLWILTPGSYDRALRPTKGGVMKHRTLDGGRIQVYEEVSQHATRGDDERKREADSSEVRHKTLDAGQTVEYR